MSKSKYPQHDIVRANKHESQTIGNFLHWLSEERVPPLDLVDRETGYRPPQSIHQLLAEYFGVNLKAFSQEKDAMVDELHKQIECSMD